MVGGRFNKHGTSELALDGCKAFALPARILRVYKKVLTGLSPVNCPDGLNHILLSQSCVHKMAPAVGKVGRTHIPRTREG